MPLYTRSNISFDAPPNCAAMPQDGSDLTNKDYVDKMIDAWSGSKSYGCGDIVQYKGSRYRSIRKPNKNNSPTLLNEGVEVINSTYWRPYDTWSYRGDYDESTYYLPNDVVRYNNLLYIYIYTGNTANITPRYPENSYWRCILPPAVAKGMPAFTIWASGILYEVGDLVFFNDIFYKCKVKHTSTPDGELGPPTTNTTHWQEYTVFATSGTDAAPSSTESAPTALSDSTGTYTAACPVLDSDTYLIKQEALAPEYYASTAYNIGDVCTYHGKLWTRTAYDGQTGLAPEGMAVQGWEETSLVNLIPSDISMQRRPIRQMTSLQIDMSDDATVFILPSQSNPVISLLHTATVTGSQGSFSQSYWGTNLVEFQLFIPMTVQATALKWNAQEVLWLRGSASDLVADKTHIVRMRLIPQLSMGTPGQILAEYVGGYVPT